MVLKPIFILNFLIDVYFCLQSESGTESPVIGKRPHSPSNNGTPPKRCKDLDEVWSLGIIKATGADFSPRVLMHCGLL